jgi:hypothetical protein
MEFIIIIIVFASVIRPIAIIIPTTTTKIILFI